MGIDPQRFAEEVNPDLLCKICSKVVEEPVECARCQFHFCFACVEDWRKNNEKCPNRCKFQLQKPHRIIKRLLALLKIHCKYSDRGCSLLLNLDSYLSHEENDCHYRDIPCFNKGCEEIITPITADEHLPKCPYELHECKECGHKMFLPELEAHSCIQSIKDDIEKCSLQIQSNETSIITLKEALSVTSSKHTGIECKVCHKVGFSGTRNICADCPDYNVCWKCRNKCEHKHNSFVQITLPGFHEGVECNGCQLMNIPGLRFKCRVCPNFGNTYLDLCIKCKNTKDHIHEQFFVWTPYLIEVTSVKPPSIGATRGDTFEREWEVKNLGLENIVRPTLVCFSGEPCSNHYTADNIIVPIDVEIPPLTSRIVKIKETVTLGTPGVYNSAWRMRARERLDYFGPEFKYDIVIIH